MEKSEYDQLLEIIAKLDPQMFQVIKLVEFVRRHGYGRVEVIIQDKRIKLVHQTLDHRTS